MCLPTSEKFNGKKRWITVMGILNIGYLIIYLAAGILKIPITKAFKGVGRDTWKKLPEMPANIVSITEENWSTQF